MSISDRFYIVSPDITDQELVTLILRHQNIETLDLSRCMNITHLSLQHLNQLPRLKYLDLSGCDQLGYKDIACLASRRKLTKLDISGCTLVTDDDIKLILAARRKNLLPNLVIEQHMYI